MPIQDMMAFKKFIITTGDHNVSPQVSNRGSNAVDSAHERHSELSKRAHVPVSQRKYPSTYVEQLDKISENYEELAKASPHSTAAFHQFLRNDLSDEEEDGDDGIDFFEALSEKDEEAQPLLSPQAHQAQSIRLFGSSPSVDSSSDQTSDESF